MANQSNCNIELHGTTNNIANVIKELNLNIKNDWLEVHKYMSDNTIDQKAGYSCSEVTYFNSDEHSIDLALIGRWCAPHQYIEDLAKKYTLSGIYTDDESGCDFFHMMKFKDGVKTKDVEDEYFSQLSIDQNGIEYYIEDYQWITEEEDWEDNNDELLALFKANGYSLKQLKKEWSCT